MKYLLFCLLLPMQLFSQSFTAAEISRWQQQAKQVNIIRDNWGIPHIYGKTDADAVFGLLYAQCEDDFKRVEMNYIEKLGRLAEVQGVEKLYDDIYLKLIIDSAEAVADYKKSPVWLKKLLQAYADGINYFLYKNPNVKPLLLHRFQPWYPLLWTDGSIGAISTGDITAADVKAMYTNSNQSVAVNPKRFEEISTGSNGFAIGPSKTSSGNAILYINPHVTFYFRPEVHMVSEEGLNVYGAVTWGQFFIYQGFNEYCGWMHTSNNVDVSDMYAVNIKNLNKKNVYQFDNKWKPVQQKNITVNYKDGDKMLTKTVTAQFTHHGPVMAKRDNRFIAVQSFNRSLTSLIQSWQRTKAKGFADYKKTMDLKANTSNNTVFADNKGNIAYWHGNHIPKRDASFDWGKVVDGTTSKTDWKGLHRVDETVHVYNPATGWIQNCNSTPFSVSGESSPLKANYPQYMAPDGESFRGINAIKVLSKQAAFDIDKTIAAGYDTYMAAFAILVPSLIKAYDANAVAYPKLEEPINLLRGWNYYADENSVPTTLAIEWAQLLNPIIRKIYVEQGEKDQVQNTIYFADTASATTLLQPLLQVVNNLEKQFGQWTIPWGAINRYQRISSDINQQYDDSKPSVAVPFASALWGTLPSYNSRYFPGTKKRYGVSGNSFVCAVEFGKKITAKSLLAGGNSGNPASPHFNDQLEMYTKGTFKKVLFYKADVLQHVERQYHPGE
jgi:acyl-homoserine lactone acylase PvdQ